MECPICGGSLNRRKVTYSQDEILLGKFEADVCNKCGETFFTEEASNLIERKAKESGIWGLGKKSKISYSGNSLILRIPVSVAKFMNLSKGEEVFIHPQGRKKLVVETG